MNIENIVYSSAIVAEHKKDKLYDSDRVVQIFEMVVQPKHHAFRSHIPTPTCTGSDIESAIAKHEAANMSIQCQKDAEAERLNDEILHEAYLASLIGVRQTLRNTTRGTYYLLPENVFENGFLNYDELRELPLRARMIVLKNSSEVDRFLVEPVSKFSYHLLDLSLEELE